MWACIHSSGDGITVLEITLDEVAHYLWSPSIGYMLKCQHYMLKCQHKCQHIVQYFGEIHITVAYCILM